MRTSLERVWKACLNGEGHLEFRAAVLLSPFCYNERRRQQNGCMVCVRSLRKTHARDFLHCAAKHPISATNAAIEGRVRELATLANLAGMHPDCIVLRLSITSETNEVFDDLIRRAACVTKVVATYVDDKSLDATHSNGLSEQG
jgi:hypothetical protein